MLYICKRKHKHTTLVIKQTNKMEELSNINEIERLKPVKQTLENMKKGAVITAPRYQKSSIRSTMDRIKDVSHKRYSIKTINSIIQIKRVI